MTVETWNARINLYEYHNGIYNCPYGGVKCTVWFVRESTKMALCFDTT